MTLSVCRLHDFFSIPRVASIACAVVAGLLAAPALAHAQTATIVGSLSNFDVENETEDEQEGFQIELEGLELNDITRVFGKSGSTCFIRYCGGSVRSFVRPDGTFGVLVEWKATFDPATQRFTTPPDAPGGGSSGTPSSFGAPLAPGVLTGEACWSLGSGAAYPTSGCEHFGVSTARNPTKPPIYRWMKGDPATGVVAPGTVTTAAGAVVPAPPVAVQHPIAKIVVDAKGIEQIEAVIEAPRPIDDIEPLANPRRFGKAEWVKVYKAEVPRQADLDELVGGHPNNVVPFAQPGANLPSCADVADDTPCVDMEWKLLQFDQTNQDNGSSVLRSSAKSNSRSHAVIRRYEFFKYIGPVVAPGGTSGKKGERLSTDDQEQSNCQRSVPGDLTTDCLSAPAEEIGQFIGAQMAAQNIGAAPRFTQTITGFTLPATATFNDPPFTVSATGGGSGNPVLFTASGACTNTFGGPPVITITGTGVCMVIASQDGDVLFSAAAPVTLTVNVEKANATVTFDAATLSQTYSGTVKTVSVTTTPEGLPVDVSLTGTAQNAGDYLVTATINDNHYTGSASGTLTIGKADAAVSISGFTGTYDGAAHGAIGTATGVNAESLTALLDLGASFTNAPGGVANWTFAGDANYKVAAGTAAITINKATPTITWAPPASITSGTALGATQLNATASVPGGFSYAPTAGTVLAVGAGQLLSVAFTPTDTVDYNNAAASVSIAVTPPTVPVVTIAPIADQTSMEGDEVELRVVVIGAGVRSRTSSGRNKDEEERGDRFSASGLPGGLEIDNDGRIRGHINRDTARTYNVMVTFTSDGVRVVRTFMWRVTAGAPRRSNKG